METGHITVSILFMILAANIYSRMLALSGLPQQMGGYVGDNFTIFIIVYVLILILLGMILDSISIMLLSCLWHCRRLRRLVRSLSGSASSP